VGWQGVTTRLASASKEEQRCQRAPGRRNRVRSVVTQQVSGFVVKNLSVRADVQREGSGQLPDLGSTPTTRRMSGASCA
jgi:hypothetical protein